MGSRGFVFGLYELAPDSLAGRTTAHQVSEALGALDRGAGEVDTGEAGDRQCARQGDSQSSAAGE
jgi:hypothetical protein